VKVFERAIFSPRFLNDLRLTYKDEPQQTTSISSQQAIIVLGAFNSGGAQITQQQEEKAAAIQDVATVGWGKQTIMFGGGARPRFFHVTDSSNFGGTFTFASLASYSAGQPELFTMNQGNPQISFAQKEYYTFVQDEVQLHPSFSLSLGLRYEWQSNVDYRNNFAPRVAFAYAPARVQRSCAEDLEFSMTVNLTSCSNRLPFTMGIHLLDMAYLQALIAVICPAQLSQGA